MQGVRRDAWSFNQEQLKKHNQYTLPDFYSDPDTLTGAAKKIRAFGFGAEPTMICENCQKNEAVVHLTDIVNNTKKEYRLCKECAGIHGVSIQAQIKKHKQFTLPDFYSDPDTSTGSGRGDAADQECSQCGMSYSLFRKEGKFGCSHDYQCFRTELDSLLEKIHASSQHLGRTPGRFRKQVSSRAQLTQLREELSNAISDEQYEKAAAIRDQMRNLESLR